jgi:vancomycin permeability regulator SanA
MGRYSRHVASRKELVHVMTSRQEQRRRQRKVRGAVLLLCLVLCVGFLAGGVNRIMVKGETSRILSPERAVALEGVDCILVLGARVMPDGSPSDMLADRLLRAVALYNAGASLVLLMSGDGRQKKYDEVSCMKRYAMSLAVPSEDILLDTAGLSTYDSMYRAKAIFGAKKIVIVTQQYHLYRALYIARQLGLDAHGVSCDYRTYATAGYNNAREFLARLKDYFKCKAL